MTEVRRLGLPEFGLGWPGLKMHPAATVKSDNGAFGLKKVVL